MEWKDPPAQLNQHVVICNCNEKAGRIVEELQAARLDRPIDVVLLIQDLALWKAHTSWHPRNAGTGVYTVLGCPTSERDLRKAQISTAQAAILLADPAHGSHADARSALVAMAIEGENPQVHTVMELLSSVSRVHLQATEVNEIICLGEISEKLIAQNCISPGVQNLFLHLLTTGQGTNQIFITPLPETARGMPYRDLARATISGGAPFVLCGYIRLSDEAEAATGAQQDAGKTHVINPRAGQHPGKDTPLQQQDRLVIIARDPPELEPYL